MDTTRHEGFSIIVPTYREAENIPLLVKRIAGVDFGNHPFEVILVDDNSQDGTIETVRELSTTNPWLKLITRQKPRDLSASIIEGYYAATFPILITLDADLSHPPEKILPMLDLLIDPSVDAVIGSRYIKGGSTDPSWPRLRIFTSRLAAFIAQFFLATRATDPLSGFLAIRKKTLLAGAPLKPIGWKIGLEIMIKCRCQNIREIPIHFSQRRHGSSKLNLKISFAYLRHVAHLLWYKIFAT